MNTLAISLGIQPYMPPPGTLYYHQMADDQESGREATLKGCHDRKERSAASVFSAISDGCDTADLIRYATKLSDGTVRTALKTLIADGRIVRTKTHTSNSIPLQYTVAQ